MYVDAPAGVLQRAELKQLWSTSILQTSALTVCFRRKLCIEGLETSAAKCLFPEVSGVQRCWYLLGGVFQPWVMAPTSPSPQALWASWLLPPRYTQQYKPPSVTALNVQDFSPKGLAGRGGLPLHPFSRCAAASSGPRSAGLLCPLALQKGWRMSL